MTTAIETQIKEHIQSFANELERLVRQSALDALRAVLDGQSAPARGRRGRPAGRRPGRPSSAPTEGLADKITAHVSSNPGQTVGQIVAATGSSPAAVKKTIKAMLDAGGIRKTGQKRGTRYFPAGRGRLPGGGSSRRRGKRASRRASRGTRKARKAPRAKRKARKQRAASRASKKAAVMPVRRKTRPGSTSVTSVPEALQLEPAVA
jgi:hypothetical protein